MSANVETMFYTRVAPWHGLGVCVENAVSSEEAFKVSGLDWNVVQRSIMTEGSVPIPGYKANIRDTDNKILGVVSDRYKVVQNAEAFAFTDALLGEGVTYETAGSLQQGKKIWLLAKLPEKYNIMGEQIEPYLVFSNSHDGSGAIKVAMTPVRVVCQNTLNLALSSAKRIWSTAHIGEISEKMYEARNTLAVQILEKLRELSEKSLAEMAEKVSGSFVFTLLDKRNNSYFVKGDNPLALYHFKAGFYIYASTNTILDKALNFLGLSKFPHEEVQSACGDILKIDSCGKLTRSHFQYND